ncbi:patatin-like phospholipase family protein [Nocardia stercoris]|uniref:Patatin-like phospholipase family protein n=2 Tax=Nocardia stercoris TaxID=2483361 RepID=A0A3M2L9C5_9NOCA|nr:patatin-like phospholipase family protein [Nocardia stercoris]
MGVQRAVVLGGGGVAGIAWANGIVVGLADAGVDVTGADLFVGTSAGSNVAAQITSGLPLAELFERQTDPAKQSAEIVPEGNRLPELMATWTRIGEEAQGDSLLTRKLIGRQAVVADTVPAAARRAVVESRLPVHDWPQQQRLLVTAVDVDSGELRVFDRDSGVALVDAVTASSAVPLVWPVTTIGDARYTDGGIRTTANADLAGGAARILIIAPMPDQYLDDEIAALTADGSRVELIVPDEASVTAFGVNPLDTVTRVPSAEAGRAQGNREATRIAELWN